MINIFEKLESHATTKINFWINSSIVC